MALTSTEPGIPVRRMLVVDPDARHARSTLQPLRALGAQVDWAEGVPDSVHDYDLVLVDVSQLAGAERERVMARASRARMNGSSGPPGKSTRIVYSLSGQRRDEMAELWKQELLSNFLAHNATQVNSDDLLATVQKMLRGDIFGMEKYFRWAVERTPYQLTRSGQKPELIAFAEDYARARQVHPLLVNAFLTVVDELVSNAFYDAPVDDQGRHLYADWSRRREVVLQPGQEIAVTFCCDGKRLGVSVVDPFGSLRPGDVQRYLAKCARGGTDQVNQGDGGAGLGLYQVFEGLSHFVANIEPRRRTEVIGLLDLRDRYRDFVTQAKSLNIFVAS